MDLNFQLFKNNLNLLGQLLSGAPVSSEAIEAYYRSIKHLSDERFVECCEAAISQLEFFPKPAWMLAKAAELAHAASQERNPLPKVLPFAEPESGVTACPVYVRKWLRTSHERNKELMEGLALARKQALNRLKSEYRSRTGKQLTRLNATIAAQVEQSAEVVAAKNKFLDVPNYLEEMHTIRDALSEEEGAACEVEWTVAEVTDAIGSIPKDDAEDF